jgi:hypothetical protein
MSKVTVKKKASGTPRKGATSHKSKSVSESSLSKQKVQRHAASPTGAKKASATLNSGRPGSKSKTVSGSALSQVRNPRSGRFVKINKATGTIISHKKSKGAYKGVPITRSSSARK